MRYVEQYRINGRHYGIEAAESGGFKLWAGGCGVGSDTTLEGARRLLHIYAVSCVRNEEASHRRRADAAASVMKKLDGDVFRMARFAVYE
jgi:hypothetical protein